MIGAPWKSCNMNLTSYSALKARCEGPLQRSRATSLLTAVRVHLVPTAATSLPGSYECYDCVSEFK